MPKVAKKVEKKAGESGVERSHDLPWSEKKVALFKLLRSPKLNGGEGTAKQISDLSNGKLTARDVRHYAYHAKAGGLVKVSEAVEGEGIAYHFSLTANGRKIDADAAFKAQQEARKSKPKSKVEKAPKAKAKKAVKKTKPAKTEATAEATAG